MPYAPGTGGSFVQNGPGKIYAGPVGTTEPTDLTTALNAAWLYVGYTDAGHTFTSTRGYENIEVAETLLPLRKVATSLDEQLEFAFAEITAKNLQRALNGATIAASGTGPTSIDKVEPLAFGATETRIALLWEADNQSERFVFRKCLQTGPIAVARQRGATKATIPVTFSLEQPDGGLRPWFGIVKGEASVT